MANDYDRVKPGDPMYGWISWMQSRGHKVCDARDHNEESGCPNPDCFKHRPNKQ